METVRNAIIGSHYKQNYNIKVSSIAKRVGNRDIAEEIVQEAYTRALKYWHSFNPDMNSFNVWLNGIIENACKDAQAQERNRGLSSDEELELVPDVQEDVYNLLLIQDTIGSAVQDRGLRNIAYLHFRDGLSAREVSQLTTSHGYGTIRNFLTKLRKVFKGEV